MSNENDYLPECWDDDVRMSALFAPPRSQTTNPQDWQGKYKFWSQAITNWALKTKTVAFDLADLKKVFWRKGVVPASLAQVVQEMQRQRRIVGLAEYTGEAPSTWIHWGVRVVKTTAAWSWNKVMESVFQVEKDLPKFVLPDVLENLSRELLGIPEAQNGETVEVQELVDNYPDMLKSLDDAHVLLAYLRNAGKVALEMSLERPMVKFLGDKNIKSPVTSPGKAEKPQITMADKGLAMLKHTEKLLHNELALLRKDIEELGDTARNEVKRGNRAAAKAALHRRKLMQKLEDKRILALTNIQTMEFQLKQAQTDSKVMEAYDVGLAALKDSLKGLPSGSEKVEDTLIELENVLEKHEEIQAALSGTLGDQDLEELDLEEELKQIMETEEERRAVPEAVEGLGEILPSPPTFSPESRKEQAQKPKRMLAE